MRTVLAAVIAASVISTGVGFAMGRVSDPPAAGAASSDARAITKSINHLDGDFRTATNSFEGHLQTIEHATTDLDNARLGHKLDGANALLLYICRSGYETAARGGCPVPLP